FYTNAGVVTLYVCDFDRNAATATVLPLSNEVMGIASARTSTGLNLIATAEQQINVWNATGQRLVGPLGTAGEATVAIDLAIDPVPDAGGRRHVLLAGGSLVTNRARLWDLTSAPPVELLSLPGHEGDFTRQMAFGRDARTLVVGR